jgi:type II secretory pathway predicted ATPase ExeA
MYLSHFGLRAQPFRTTPDAEAYYASTTHETAIAELTRAREDEQGLMLLQGDPGTGKTLVAHRLIEAMPAKSRTVLLTHAAFRERADLLQAILFDLGLRYQQMTEQELRLSLIESCLDHFRGHGHTVIVVDEAHLLSAALLEELRLLSNLEGKEGKAVQVLLVGLPTIIETIETPALAILRQRLTVRCELAPLSVEESADYLLHQIRRSGGNPDRMLGEDVLDILSHACRGVPRILNQAAHLAFTLACGSGARTVDAEAAVESVTRLGLDPIAEQVMAGEKTVEELPAALLPPRAAALSVLRARDQGPPVYVYGGGPEMNDRLAEGAGQRVWQSTPQRAG